MENTLEHTVNDRIPEDILELIHNSNWKPRTPTPKEIERSARAERTRLYRQPINFGYLLKEIKRYFNSF